MQEDFGTLRQLILLEEFKNSVAPGIKMHLEDHKVRTLQKAAVMADDYELSHKRMFVSEKRVCHQDSREDLGGGVDSGFSRGVQSRTEKSVWLPSRMPSGPTCHYCKKRGHIKAECWKLQSELGRESGSKPVGLVSLGSVSEVRDNDGTLDRFQGFISEGSVLVNGKQSPVVVLRDTGASQSLLVDSVVDLDDATSCNAYVLIQGVGGKFMPVPLHQVELRSNVISGQVTVGVVSTLPVPGVTFILGK